LLHEFLTLHRAEVIARTRQKVAARSVSGATQAETENGVPLFLDQLAETLRREQQTSARPTSAEMVESAVLHGGELRKAGFTLGQVVHGYGDVCQAVTALAMELAAPISADEFKTLNRCLDDAIAQAVTEFARQRDISVADMGIERQGFFVHELRNSLGSALMAFEMLKTGSVGIGGSTGAVLERSLLALRDLIDRSVGQVRAEVGLPRREHVLVSELLEEVEQASAIEARARNLRFTVSPAPAGLAIDVDRQPIAGALANLLQNAFKFSRSNGHVVLRTDAVTSPGRILIEVEDECGGLAPDGADALFLPFEQRGEDRSGLGLGLAIARGSVRANGGEIRARSVPGQGCIFTIELPLFGGPGPGTAEVATVARDQPEH
jgi:signal transduction histidine kinase